MPQEIEKVEVIDRDQRRGEGPPFSLLMRFIRLYFTVS